MAGTPFRNPDVSYKTKRRLDVLDVQRFNVLAAHFDIAFVFACHG